MTIILGKIFKLARFFFYVISEILSQNLASIIVKKHCHIFCRTFSQNTVEILAMNIAKILYWVFNKIFCKRPDTSFRRSDFKLLYIF